MLQIGSQVSLETLSIVGIKKKELKSPGTWKRRELEGCRGKKRLEEIQGIRY